MQAQPREEIAVTHSMSSYSHVRCASDAPHPAHTHVVSQLTALIHSNGRDIGGIAWPKVLVLCLGIPDVAPEVHAPNWFVAGLMNIIRRNGGVTNARPPDPDDPNYDPNCDAPFNAIQLSEPDQCRDPKFCEGSCTGRCFLYNREERESEPFVSLTDRLNDMRKAVLDIHNPDCGARPDCQLMCVHVLQGRFPCMTDRKRA